MKAEKARPVADRTVAGTPARSITSDHAAQSALPLAPRTMMSAVVRRTANDPRSMTAGEAIQLQRTIGNAAVGRLLNTAAPCTNQTGLPDRLKSGVESFSGVPIDDVRVHYNSSRPAEVDALAFTQGTDIHVAPGQEHHLPHEAWHVVQQKQGRVKPTLQVDGLAINDDAGLEREADRMGPYFASPQVAHSSPEPARSDARPGHSRSGSVVQRYTAINTGSFRGKRSEHAHYVTGENLSEVYVQAGNVVERSYKTTEIAVIDGADYEVWKPTFDVIGDCVAAAEELMHGKKLKYGVPEASEFRDSAKRKRGFGESDKQNRQLGQETDLGEEANPDLLEAFVIARQGYKRDEERPQFHGATVVAQDGVDDVTLEATAPASGAISADRVTAVYDMYGRAKKRRQSFKIAFQAEYGKDATVSVIKKKKRLPKKALAPAKSRAIINF